MVMIYGPIFLQGGLFQHIFLPIFLMMPLRMKELIILLLFHIPCPVELTLLCLLLLLVLGQTVLPDESSPQLISMRMRNYWMECPHDEGCRGGKIWLA